MNIFLDVGANEGQTLDEVTDPCYKFDRIYAFEPMLETFAALHRFADNPAIRLCPYGLADRTGSLPVYGTNENCEASLFSTKTDVDETVVTVCEFVEASQFFAENLSDNDRVIVKLNCEGAEVPIIDNLIDSGEIAKVDYMMIDFDIRRVDGHELEDQRIIGRLQQIGFSRYSLCENVMYGDTHQLRTANWLKAIQ